MAVRLRLTRVGGRKDPVWRVVVADQRSKRDGRVIETVGHYNPQTNPSTISIDEERVRDWLARGAQPSQTVRKLLRIQGIVRLRGGGSAMDPTELLSYLAEGLVDDPEAVEVERFEERDGTHRARARRRRRRLRQGDRPRRPHGRRRCAPSSSRGRRRGSASLVDIVD